MDKKEDSPKKDPNLESEAQKYERPVPSREFILAELKAIGGALKRRALTKHFGLNEEELEESFRRRLNAMVRDGQLLRTPEGYLPITEIEFCEGKIVKERDGEGYLLTKEAERIALSGLAIRTHYDGDVVEGQIIQVDREGNRHARINKLITPANVKVVGRFMKSEHHFEAIPLDKKFTQNITVPKEFKAMAKEGDIVHLEILRDEKYRHHVEPVARVIEVLGDFSTPGIEISMAMRKFSLNHEWPDMVLQDAEKFGVEVTKGKKEKREDLTHLPLVTIDGEDAKDFDDAVFCESKLFGGWTLWVAIADVSYYVTPNSALDKEALHRGNSTYFPGSVIPMLPEALSNGLCSLKPNVLRMCVVCQMTISRKGLITSSKFYRAYMHSKARLTYTEVSQMIEGNATLRKKYAPLLPSIDALHAVYQALFTQRKKRGAIDFDSVENRILFDAENKIKTIIPLSRNVAHKMIEESMLAANVCAAEFIEKHKRGTLFRVHDRPPRDKLSSLRQFLAELGLDLPGKQQPTAKDFSALIEKIQHREDKHIIETVMLRSLSQAQYSPNNVGHFGLAYPIYLHFTSPIRRYPDLLVHRVINDILYEKKPNKLIDDPNTLEKLGAHCSETERRSDDATRDATLSLKCHFMQDKVGEQFHGVISGVTSFGIFVELKDIYVEGLIHVTALGNEYFYFDPIHHRMIGDATRTIYRLGDGLDVKVVRVDVETKRIDLELINFPRKAKNSGTQKTSKSPKKPTSNKPSRSRRRARRAKGQK